MRKIPLSLLTAHNHFVIFRTATIACLCLTVSLPLLSGCNRGDEQKFVEFQAEPGDLDSDRSPDSKQPQDTETSDPVTAQSESDDSDEMAAKTANNGAETKNTIAQSSEVVSGEKADTAKNQAEAADDSVKSTTVSENRPDVSPAMTSKTVPDLAGIDPALISPELSERMLRNKLRNGKIAADDAKLEPLEPREPKLLIAEKEFTEEGPEKAIRVTFDDIDLLKVLNMEPVPEDAVSMFPAWLKNLDGRKVVIRGFMFPTLSQTGITYFQHVRDNEICCFGRTPKVYDRISTLLRDGHPTRYIQGRPFDVVGTLRMDPVYEDGEWIQLYLLEEARVLE